MKNKLTLKTLSVILLLFASLPLGVFISLGILENLQNSSHAVNGPANNPQQDIMYQIGQDLKANWNTIENTLSEYFSKENLLYIKDFYTQKAHLTISMVQEIVEQQDQEVLQILRVLAILIIIAASLFFFYSKIGNPLKGRFHRDKLTKLFNREYLLTMLKDRIKEYSNIKKPFCLLVIEIDNLEQIREAYGEDKEKHLLKDFASIARKELKTHDLIFRYSDEEFAILLQYAKTEEAYNLAERLRRKVESYDFKLDHTVTISIGISEFIEENSIDELLANAQATLSKAKTEGSNHTAVYYH